MQHFHEWYRQAMLGQSALWNIFKNNPGERLRRLVGCQNKQLKI